jgi:hypothetical protein
MTDMEREARRLQELQARNRRLERIFERQAALVQLKLRLKEGTR